MTNGIVPGALTSLRALWKRALIWRISLMTALLTSLVFALYPPQREVNTTPQGAAKYEPASYTARSPPAAPQSATVAMVTANGANSNVDNETGLDPAMLGQLYRGSVLIDGFTVPLPPGAWANLANSTFKQATFAGHAHFLGKIRHKRLIGAIRIFAARSDDSPGKGFPEVKSCTEINPGRTYVAIDDEMVPQGHQACWTMRNVYATPWSRWADRDVKISALDRAAAGDMTAKGVTYPQDYMSVQFTRTEQWGLLEVMYLFSPESEGISSNTVLAVTESDWVPANIGKYPEKVAYVAKLKAWGTVFWPKFKAAYAAGQPP
jgi:hypothetical protein